MTLNSPRHARTMPFTIAGLLVILLAGTALAGWFLDVGLMQSIVPDYVTMKFNTAFCFVLSGISFLLLTHCQTRTARALFQLLALIVVFIAAVSVSQNIFNYQAGIDQLVVTDHVSIGKQLPSPGRMSPSTASCFILLGLGFIALDIKKRSVQVFAQYTLNLVTLIAFICAVGFLLKVPYTLKFHFFSSMAINTAFCFLLLSGFASAINYQLGITSLFSGNEIGNILARRLYPKMIAVLIFTGYLGVRLIRNGYISTEFGIVISTTVFLLISLYLIHDTLVKLNSLDQKRSVAELETRLLNKNLEDIVEQRTLALEESNKGLQQVKTELELLTDKLSHQNKQLISFAHITSHNLRSPVSNLNLLMHFYNESTTAEDKQELWKNFETVIGHLNTTLNDLLETLRIQEDTAKEREVLNFEEVLRSTTDILMGQIKESAAVIRADFSKAPTLLYPKVYLESIMLNLISNTLKYRSPDRIPEINISTDGSGDEIILRVSDNGLGIDLKRHGSSLFGLRKTFHRHQEAIGLGLFITKTQVEAMGGKIFAESVVDKGTTFIVEFNKK